MPKQRIAVLYGGRSAEHEISLRSARFVAAHLDPSRYEVVAVAIDRDGAWRLPAGGRQALAEGTVAGPAFVAGATTELTAAGSLTPGERPIDVVFPVLHGPLGEDGTVQGFLELAGLPYVGAGVLGSSLGMDKIAQKHMFEAHGIPTAPFVGLPRWRWTAAPDAVIQSIEQALPYPVFVKPANLGSSVGVSRAGDRAALRQALERAARYDRRLIVERAVEDAHEVECAVLGNDEPRVSIVGEIRTSYAFYDYDAKYVDDDAAELIIPAAIPGPVAERVRSLAARAFTALDLAGMARADFFAGESVDRVWINEVNTIPGFTSISMFPRLWEASGVPPGELIDELIRLAIERHRETRALDTDR